MNGRNHDADVRWAAQNLPRPVWFHFTLRQFLFAFLFIAAILGVWASLLRTAVTIRPADPNERIDEQGSYFGFFYKPVPVRNVVVAEGIFSRSTCLRASLYLAEAGKVREMSAYNLGRTSNCIGALPWESMKITLALGDFEIPTGLQIPTGHSTMLVSAGQSRGVGGCSFPTNHVPPRFSKTISGVMPVGREVILYVEGDTPPIASVDQSLKQFAKKNPGNYLVVTGRLD
jgi:hypothetical protein